MLLHTICADLYELDRLGIRLTSDDVQFVKFIGREIFPGGQLPRPGMIRDYSAKAGFELEREQSLQPHYARTLDRWAENLTAHREEAISAASQEVYNRYLRYLTGCARLFHERKVDVRQFTLVPR